MGPPGSGKGTISKRIAQSFGLQYLSSGHFLRESIAANSGRILYIFLSAHTVVPTGCHLLSLNVWRSLFKTPWRHIKQIYGALFLAVRIYFKYELAEVSNPTTTQLTLPHGFWSGAISFVSPNFLLLEFFRHTSSYRNNSDNNTQCTWMWKLHFILYLLCFQRQSFKSYRLNFVFYRTHTHTRWCLSQLIIFISWHHCNQY